MQEGKIDTGETIVELTMDNKKLTATNQNLQRNERNLRERLNEVEHQYSEIQIETQIKDNMLAVLKAELDNKTKEVIDLEEKNKNLTGECQLLTIRILEEKSKIVEMMNEANMLYDGATRMHSESFNAGRPNRDELDLRQSELTKGQDNHDLTQLIKPEYLDMNDQN